MSGAPLKDRNVKFAGGAEAGAVPAYMRSRDELEDRAKRHAGALVTDKEAVEVGSDMQDEASKAIGRKKMAESMLDDKQPVLAFDRRLPKNAKNKQHLLSRIHTIESTLQRLYGKLEADSELPDIESIEQIMASTIKQSVYSADPGGAAATTRSQVMSDTGEGGSPLRVSIPVTPAKPGVSFDDGGGDEETGGGEEGDEGLPLDDQERRMVLRAARRKKMEERERARADKDALELSGLKGPAATVRFGDKEESMAPPDPSRMKGMMDDDDMRMNPRSVPASIRAEQGDDPRSGKSRAHTSFTDRSDESPVNPKP
ncbi:hypothetical protein T484DRAFT_3460346 [Baffinella frigidus]|nr:hypothetical protein T484DRAFT_3460346 [Cryptophyta sp. CCMP2293]